MASLIAGCVGEGSGLEFLAWRRALDLPDPEALLADPDAFKLPARGDQAFAVLTAVVSAAVSKLTKDRWLAAWAVLARAAEQGAKDITAASAKALASARRPDLPLPAAQLKEFAALLRAAGGVS